MRINVLEQNVTRLLSQRNAALVVSGLMALSNVILVGAYVMKGERTVLVPPQITREFWIEGGEVSKEYLEEMGLWMSTFLLEMNPTTASYKHKVLLKYVSSEVYGALKAQFLKDEDHYKDLQLSTSFKPQDVNADKDAMIVEVQGVLSSYMASGKVQDVPHVVTLKFSRRGAGLVLEELKGRVAND